MARAVAIVFALMSLFFAYDGIEDMARGFTHEACVSMFVACLFLYVARDLARAK